MANPTPENPIVLNFIGHIPSLKNRKQPIRAGKKLKLVPNKVVRDFVNRMKPLLEGQWTKLAAEQGFSLVPLPQRIGVYAEIVFYRNNPKLLPNSDGDNAYTTLQELLAKLIIENDKQVGYGSFDVLYTSNRALEHASVFIWVRDETITGREESGRLNVQQRSQSQTPDDVGVPELIRAIGDFETV